jgi:NhaP-type Na+/H+ and K+/H+ antiporter
VSLSVAVILFEGGLNLRIAELRKVGGVVRNLITVGVLVTWLASAVTAHFIIDLDIALAVLFRGYLGSYRANRYCAFTEVPATEWSSWLDIEVGGYCY